MSRRSRKVYRFEPGFEPSVRYRGLGGLERRFRLIGDVSGASHPVSTGARMEVLFRRSMGGALTEWEGLSREAAELRPEPVNLSNRLRESRSVRGLQSP